MTKVTDLKKLENGCRNTMIFVFQKNIFYIFLTILFAFLLTLPSTQPIEVIGLILFQ